MFDESKVKRIPAGHEGGGRFTSVDDFYTATPIRTPYKISVLAKGVSGRLKKWNSMVGTNWTEDDLASFTGLSEGSFYINIDPIMYENRLGTEIRMGVHSEFLDGSTKIGECDRTIIAIRKNRETKFSFIMENSNFELAENFRRSGFGTVTLARQVSALRRAGFERIQMNASGEKGRNGYYTWLRLGFDGKLGVTTRQKAERDLDIRAEKVSDILSLGARGGEWWKENGRGVPNAIFDLQDNSLSMQVLSSYLRHKNLLVS